MRSDNRKMKKNREGETERVFVDVISREGEWTYNHEVTYYTYIYIF